MSKKVLWLEGNSGISGDMTVGALLDLGASEAYMREQLGRLALDGYEVQISREKGGIEGCAFRVNIAKEQHQHRHYGDIVKLLSEAGLDDPVEELAQRMFYLVARAESQVHGKALEEVHFHEVGAVDSIVGSGGFCRLLCQSGDPGSGSGTSAGRLWYGTVPARRDTCSGAGSQPDCGRMGTSSFFYGDKGRNGDSYRGGDCCGDSDEREEARKLPDLENRSGDRRKGVYPSQCAESISSGGGRGRAGFCSGDKCG